MKARRSEKGMALLLVLTVVALLTSVLTDLVFSTMVDMRLTETFRDSTKAYYLAKGGINAGRMILQSDDNDYDSLHEMWSRDVVQFPVGEGSISIFIEDQDSKLALNKMVIDNNPQTIMVDRFYRFLNEMELGGDVSPAELTSALVDWLDSGGTPYTTIRTDGQSLPVAGAEEAYYQSLTPAYQCKNGPLETLEELTLIKGFTPEVVEKISPFLAVNGSLSVNINTASVVVLMSLDPQINNASAQQIIDYRQESPIKDVSQLETVLEENIYIVLKSLANVGQLGTTSRIYQIKTVAGVNDGRRRLLAEVDKNDNKLHFFKVN